jgi:hypothetical protein
MIFVAEELRARIFKRLWSPGIDSKEWIPPAYVAWRAGMIILYIPTGFLAPIDFLKIPARICKPFNESRKQFPTWRAGTTTLCDVSARQAT